MKTFTMGKQIKRRGVIVAFCAMVVLALIATLSFMPKTEARAEMSTNGLTFLNDSELKSQHFRYEVLAASHASFIKLTNNVDNTKTSEGIMNYYHNTTDLYVLVPRSAPFSFEGFVFKDITVSRSGTPINFTHYNADYFAIHSSTYPDYITFTYNFEPIPVQLPDDPVKEGHHFVGWYYDEELTRPYNGEPIYADTTLYPKFEINTYTVTYDSNNGTAVNPATVNWNSAAPTPTPTRTGYNFVGWYTLAGMKYNGEAITSNVTLVARWEIKVFTVTFMTENNEVYATLQVEYGTRLVKAMEAANMLSYSVSTLQGVPVSKQSIITENAEVLVTELTDMEKVGNYIGTHEWIFWAVVGLLCALSVTSIVSITVAVKRGQ